MNVPISATIGRRVNSPIGKDRSTTTQQTRNEMNISINNFVRAEHSETEREAVVLRTACPDPIIQPEPLKSSTFTEESEHSRAVPGALGAELECEDLCDNVDLKRFRFHNNDKLEICLDVLALKNIIRVLIQNHNIVTTAKDLEDIISYWGETEIKTEKQAILTRSPKKSGFCGCSDEEIGEFVNTITKISLNGINILKRLPTFIACLQELGLSV
jgi:hypothetical protein